jgi:hypothetical protein
MTDGTAFEPGCYIDSHHGHYAIPGVITLARKLGYEVSPETDAILARYDTDSHEPDYPGERVIEESDAAIEWLNDNQAREGFAWAWNDGDFGLYPTEEDE